MSLFGSPAPQWTDSTAAAMAASRVIPFLDTSGYWTLIDSPNTPSGAFVNDPGGSGYVVIDSTIAVGLKPALAPSGAVIFY